MKKNFALLILISVTTVLSAQRPATVVGSFNSSRFSEVKLYAVENGEPKEMATIKPNKNGRFGFNFFPEYEGYFMIGTGTVAAPQNNYKFWLKPGDKLEFKLTDSTYELTGKNTKENEILAQWYKMAWLSESKSIYFLRTQSTYVDFFPELDRLIHESEQWISKLKSSGNKTFDAALNKTIKPKKVIRKSRRVYFESFLAVPEACKPFPSLHCQRKL